MINSLVTQEQVDSISWFHSMDFGNGILSKGQKPRSFVIDQADVIFKHGVDGKSVMDIGAWDGAFSFEAEKRGASRVLAVDRPCWGGGLGTKQGFDLAKRAYSSNVEELVSDVFDLDAANTGTFDVVLFLGVLYHLKEPLRALELVGDLTHDMLIIDTETSLDNLSRPAMSFFPGAELNNDPTNWWAPNIKCVEAMLGVAGFKRVEVSRNPSWKEPINASRGRHIFHAWR